MFLGTIGFFVMMMFLFVRFIPMINMFEMKELLHRQEAGHDHAAEPASEVEAVAKT